MMSFSLFHITLKPSTFSTSITPFSGSHFVKTEPFSSRYIVPSGVLWIHRCVVSFSVHIKNCSKQWCVQVYLDFLIQGVPVLRDVKNLFYSFQLTQKVTKIAFSGNCGSENWVNFGRTLYLIFKYLKSMQNRFFAQSNPNLYDSWMFSINFTGPIILP